MVGMDGRRKSADMGPVRLTSENATAKTMRSLLTKRVFKDYKPLLDDYTGKNLSQSRGLERNLERDGDSYRMLQHPSH